MPQADVAASVDGVSRVCRRGVLLTVDVMRQVAYVRSGLAGGNDVFRSSCGVGSLDGRGPSEHFCGACCGRGVWSGFGRAVVLWIPSTLQSLLEEGDDGYGA